MSTAQAAKAALLTLSALLLLSRGIDDCCSSRGKDQASERFHNEEPDRDGQRDVDLRLSSQTVPPHKPDDGKDDYGERSSTQREQVPASFVQRRQ